MNPTKAATTNAATDPQHAAAEHGTIWEALVAFQAEAPIIVKQQTAKIPGRDGGQGYSYRYADLADIVEQATPVLAKHGLGWTCTPQRVEGGAYELVGRLVHVKGGDLEGALPITGRSAQELGSSLTYLRRYLFTCLTGLVTDEDDDGQRANAAKARTQVDRGPAAIKLWAEAQETTSFDAIKVLWHKAAAGGLLDEEVEHMDGAKEPLRSALRRLGDSLQTAGA